MKQATAVAPANIAFIKYWGRKDDKLRLPANDSLSMNLSGIETTTTVKFGDFDQDKVEIDGHAVQDHEYERVVAFLDRIRDLAKIKDKCLVESKNAFPRSVGLASSASAFAALTKAATVALGLNLSEKELSKIARLGSGSACRSIPDGFVQWQAGVDNGSSFAFSLYDPDYWDLVDVIALSEFSPKKVGSAKGHVAAQESPFYQARLKSIEDHLNRAKKAFSTKDFQALGEVIEEDSLSMHVVMMTSYPNLFYWNGVTIEILKALQDWRLGGLMAYATIDAGPNVHVICQRKDEAEVVSLLRNFMGVNQVLVAYPSPGARIIDQD